MKKRLEKYLAKKGQFRKLVCSDDFRGRTFRDIVVIPVLAEFAEIFKTLDSLAKISEDELATMLVILVINNRKDATVEQKVDNGKLLGHLELEKGFPGLNLCWIDACSEGQELPPKTGVGLARRIGLDSALKWLSSETLLYCLDADTLVDINYLMAARKRLQPFKTESHWIGAGHFSFTHQPADSPELQMAIEEYEAYLRHYVEGLREAGSPYAYQTIGSTIVCTPEAYLLADGMPIKRLAGEDFYFLQNVAKHCQVVEITASTVSPSARISMRTPYGTGKRLSEFQQSGTAQRFYRAESFATLKELLTLVEENLQTRSSRFIESLSSEKTKEFLSLNKFDEVWTKLNTHYNTSTAMKRAFYRWFDAFRTLKFIHYLEEK